jgi:hypothetical protein
VRYLSFSVANYRGIVGPLTIEVARRPLTPIVGVNESGKTTVLQAIFAFDFYNDKAGDGRHLKDVVNLYKTSPSSATITARVAFETGELESIVKKLQRLPKDPAQIPSARARIQMATALHRKRNSFPQELSITRTLPSGAYRIAEQPFAAIDSDKVAREIIRELPYILYFDDFRDRIDERIEIPTADESSATGWLECLEQLFRKTDSNLSVFQVPRMEDRQRKNALAKVQRQLSLTLTQEWKDFRLDDRDALNIELDYVEEAAGDGKRHYIKLDVVETDANEEKHFFYVSDRSKGFFWFFNFVMKLEFNPKSQHGESGGQGCVYLLDEPGSYLHAVAQTKLCRKLRRLSEGNVVVYCTHSHYLLDPDVIPFPNVVVAERSSGAIGLTSVLQWRPPAGAKGAPTAFQPVLDALRIRPFALDSSFSDIAIVEGIYDYYALELFRRRGVEVGVLPCRGADRLADYVPLLLARQMRFVAMWDDDEKGREALRSAAREFGEELAERSFVLLPGRSTRASWKLESCFDRKELAIVRKALELPENTSFERCVARWFYSHRREELCREASTTAGSFERVWAVLVERLAAQRGEGAAAAGTKGLSLA